MNYKYNLFDKFCFINIFVKEIYFETRYKENIYENIWFKYLYIYV